MKNQESSNPVACCPLCGSDNSCRRVATVTYKGPCWCELTDISEELLRQLPPASRGTACICPTCVAKFNRSRAYQPSPEKGDYYHDSSGQWVYTEAFHRRRGYCCGSGCRHCPYETTGPGGVA